MEFKFRIRDLRREQNLSGEKLAKLIGTDVSRHTVSAWENGKNYPNIKTCFRLCEIFNCSMDYLLGRTDDRTPYDAIVDKETREKIEQGLLVITDAKDLDEEDRKQINDFVDFIRQKKERP